MLQEKNKSPKTGTGEEMTLKYVPSVTKSAKPSPLVNIVVPNPSIDTLKSGDESGGTGIQERLLMRKYQSAGGKKTDFNIISDSQLSN